MLFCVCQKFNETSVIFFSNVPNVAFCSLFCRQGSLGVTLERLCFRTRADDLLPSCLRCLISLSCLVNFPWLFTLLLAPDVKLYFLKKKKSAHKHVNRLRCQQGARLSAPVGEHDHGPAEQRLASAATCRAKPNPSFYNLYPNTLSHHFRAWKRWVLEYFQTLYWLHYTP